MRTGRSGDVGSAPAGSGAGRSRPEGRSHDSRCSHKSRGARNSGGTQRRLVQALPHSSALRAGRWSWPGHCYFITTNCADKQALLADDRCAQAVVDSLGWLQRQERIRLMGFVVMPDHVHLAFVLGGDEESRSGGRSHTGSVSSGIVGAPFRARPASIPSNHAQSTHPAYRGLADENANSCSKRTSPFRTGLPCM